MSCFKDFILHIVYHAVSVHWTIWKFNTRPTCKHAFLKTWPNLPHVLKKHYIKISQ